MEVNGVSSLCPPWCLPVFFLEPLSIFISLSPLHLCDFYLCLFIVQACWAFEKGKSTKVPAGIICVLLCGLWVEGFTSTMVPSVLTLVPGALSRPILQSKPQPQAHSQISVQAWYLQFPARALWSSLFYPILQHPVPLYCHNSIAMDVPWFDWCCAGVFIDLSVDL